MKLSVKVTVTLHDGNTVVSVEKLAISPSVFSVNLAGEKALKEALRLFRKRTDGTN